MNELIDLLTARGHKIEWFDMGGGFGVNYQTPDQAFPVTEHANGFPATGLGLVLFNLLALVLVVSALRRPVRPEST